MKKVGGVYLWDLRFIGGSFYIRRKAVRWALGKIAMPTFEVLAWSTPIALAGFVLDLITR